MTNGADLDGTALTLVVLPGSRYTVSRDTIVPTANWNGTLTVPVKIVSGGDTTASVNMMVTVTAVADLPTLASATAQTMLEDGKLKLTTAMTNGADADGTALTLVVLPGSHYTVSRDTIIPTANWNGTLTVPVKIVSGGDTTASVNMTVTVEPGPTPIVASRPADEGGMLIRIAPQGLTIIVRTGGQAFVDVGIFNAHGVRVDALSGESTGDRGAELVWVESTRAVAGVYFAIAQVKYQDGSMQQFRSPITLRD
jgi:hypothetical protein